MKRYHLYTWLTGHLFIVDCSPEDLTKRKITYYSSNIRGQVWFEKGEEYFIKPKLGHILRRMRKPGCNSPNARVSDSYVYQYLLTPNEKEGLIFRPRENFSRDYLLASDDLEEIHREMVLWTWKNKCAYEDESGENLEYAIGTYITQEEANALLIEKYGNKPLTVQTKVAQEEPSFGRDFQNANGNSIDGEMGQLAFAL